MKKYGLIGYPLSHSFSKRYFTEKFEKENIMGSQYELFPIENIDALPTLLKENQELCGLNVTVPHKIGVLNYLDRVESGAKAAGAVNCIRIGQKNVNAKHDFMLEGYNTDIYGFEMSLKPLLKEYHDEALVLGDGGAAKAVKCVLEELGIRYKLVTRKPAPGNLLFNELKPHHIARHKLIINTTPVGMSPNIDECPPVPYEAITGEHLLYDLIYNPAETLFLKKGAEKGAVIKNGYEMLVLQAEKSWEIWTKKEDQP